MSDYYTTTTDVWPPLAEIMDRAQRAADDFPSGAETTPQREESATDAPSGKAPLLGGEAVRAALDPVTRPAHYALEPEPLDVIEAWGLGYHEGNIVKYITRWRSKDGVRDLRKAQEYLRRLIEIAERG